MKSVYVEAMEKATTNRIIHAAQIIVPKEGKQLLLLEEMDPQDYRWFVLKEDNVEVETDVSGRTIEEAFRNANRKWAANSFRTIICGFRYTLPERDEHGMNALFYQMAASYGTMNGVYFDEELGHNCFVQNASDEALDLWRRLKKSRG